MHTRCVMWTVFHPLPVLYGSPASIRQETLSEYPTLSLGGGPVRSVVAELRLMIVQIFLARYGTLDNNVWYRTRAQCQACSYLPPTGSFAFTGFGGYQIRIWSEVDVGKARSAGVDLARSESNVSGGRCEIDVSAEHHDGACEEKLIWRCVCIELPGCWGVPFW